MPFLKGTSPKIVQSNFHEFRHGDKFAKTEAKFGKKTAEKQMIAAVLNTERKSEGRMYGGVAPMTPMAPMVPESPMMPVPQSSMGTPGSPPPVIGVAGDPSLHNPYMGEKEPTASPIRKRGGALPFEHQDKIASNSLTKGAIYSKVPGRTDHHYTHVPSGSYVIPADIVSGRGEGNTIAGADRINKLFGMGPYKSAPVGQFGYGHTSSRSSGGARGNEEHMGKPVRVNLAGGEIVVPPENLLETIHRLNPGKKFTLKQMHAIMDAWVLAERKKLRKTLAKLPGPVKS